MYAQIWAVRIPNGQPGMTSVVTWGDTVEGKNQGGEWVRGNVTCITHEYGDGMGFELIDDSGTSLGWFTEVREVESGTTVIHLNRVS